MRLIVFAVAAVLAIAAPALADDMQDQILAVHNAERAAVGAPPLVWSDKLAADAQVWADHLTTVGGLVHDPDNPNGENLWMGSQDSYGYTEMAQTWADEKAYFTYGTFPDVSSDGNWADVGHYTQMIWSGTTEIGCARTSDGTWDYLVCRYSPAGNVIDEKPY